MRWRLRLDSRPRTAQAYRVTVGFVGATVVVLGLVLVPLPGPGWLIVLTGVAIIASEFSFARRLLRFAREKLTAWTQWVTASHWTIGTSLALLSCAVVIGVVWLVLLWLGLPGWVPRDWVPLWTGLR